MAIHATDDTDLARTLGTFAAGLELDALPPAAVERATQLIVDVVGLMLGGARTQLGRQTS
jgi:hypothetical protein